MKEDTRNEVEFRSVAMARYLPAMLKLLSHKGEQYAGKSEPALINFYEGSEFSEQTPAHYLISLATKQWHVISNWAATDPEMKMVTKREVVQRIFDVCIYMMLLLFMIENDQKATLPGE